MARSASGVFVVKDKVKKLLGALASLPKRDVLVGVPAEKTDRESGEPITNAAIAYINDKGFPALNIPARPFMGPGIEAAKGKITAYLGTAGKAAMAGDEPKIERAMHAAGLTASTSVKNKINTGPFAPLAASTLAARARRGRTGSKPLIDTGQMRNAVTYVVRKKA